MYYAYVETKVGKLLFVGDGRVIKGAHWTVFKRAPAVAPGWAEDVSVFQEVTAQLNEYLAGARRTFDVPFEWSGTDFQQSVWQELLQVPYGAHVTYQDIAKAIGNPKAVRAVGTAVGSNPISIIVPCHRVLATGGGLGGYAGGLETKMRLLRLEESL